MTLTKHEIAHSISRQTGLSKTRATDVLESLLEIIKQTLEKGDKVLISGFGKFYVRQKNPRMGRDPSTGNELPLDARRVVLFRYSEKLKRRINAGKAAGSATSNKERRKKK